MYYTEQVLGCEEVRYCPGALDLEGAEFSSRNLKISIFLASIFFGFNLLEIDIGRVTGRKTF